MRELLREFPIKSQVLVREAVGADVCPACAADLDRAKICTLCAEDWKQHVPARYAWKAPDQPEK